MNAFIDSSVILRKLLHEPQPLGEWARLTPYASRLLALEMARVLERYHWLRKIDDVQLTLLQEESRRLLAATVVIPMSERILLEAARPMGAVVGTLDAIHLATAMELRRELGASVTFATHDRQLATAARMNGFVVLGA
jgi:predicted nucleic acid-binding protein